MTGARLRARREALGRSLQELAAATRIPAQHLEALEDDRLEDLPAGPYAQVWARAVAAELGLEASESEEAPPVAQPPQGAPLWLVRALAVSSLMALFVVLASWAWERVRPVIDAPRITTSTPDQHLAVSARRTTRVSVTVDGEPSFDGELSGGERKEFAGRDRVEISVESLSAVGLSWNGVDLVPQGVQDAPRRRVFVDDAGGAEWAE